ncbi:MAG: hypothetical protein M1822_005315 [Bathelium mastoideum]|nr:MAG: hypothetical protein M1822_005315 [Bathelium mastoideum]
MGESFGEKTIDADALKLAELGYAQDTKRNLSVWSVLGVGFSITNSWLGIALGLASGINSGGPILVIYGLILMALIAVCVGVSLSELASALPNAGGQYFWTNELAPKRFANFSSYLTGWFAWAGSIFSTASVALSTGSALVGCYQLGHPDFVIEPWHVFVAYQVANLFCFLFNTQGRILPLVGHATFYCSLISFFITMVTIPAVAPTHQHAKFVFATFINNTGWSSNGIAFIVGLVNTNWCFSCLDGATHLAEEVHRPERMIPIAIMGTVAIGFVTSWFWSISMFFSIVGDFDAIANSATGVPLLQLFENAATSIAGATVLEALIVASGLGCLIACHTWQSRLCWSFARDRGVPGHQWLKRITPGCDVPIPAHVTSCLLVAVIGCLHLASSTALNSVIAALLVLLYVSYSIPVICLLAKGRNSIKHGPFWLGSFGLFCNIILLLWTVFTIVMFSFPYSMPATADTMNYVSAVYAIVCIIVGVDWVLRGRWDYRGQAARRAEAEDMVRRETTGR